MMVIMVMDMNAHPKLKEDIGTLLALGAVTILVIF